MQRAGGRGSPIVALLWRRLGWLTLCVVLVQALVLIVEFTGAHSKGSVPRPPFLAPLLSNANLTGTVPEEQLMQRRHVPRKSARPNVTLGATPFYFKGQAVPRSKLPNILLMVADDLQLRDLGSGVTPHTDAIGATGVRFGNAHTPGPLCTPSRYALLTGRHPSCHFAGAPRPVVEQVGLNGTMGMFPALASIGFNINLPLRMPAVDAIAEGHSAANGRLTHGSNVSDRQYGPASSMATATPGLRTSADMCSMPTAASLLRQRGYATGVHRHDTSGASCSAPPLALICVCLPF